MSKDIETEIVRWLKEEKLSPERLEDPNAFFNYKIKINEIILSVVQNTRFNDSITVSCLMLFTPDQLRLLDDGMDVASKREYFNKIVRELTLHPYIWDFQIDENKEVVIHSKRLYYCNLTKDNLMHMVYLIAKMIRLPLILMDDYFQEFWPEWEDETRGRPDLEKMR